MERLGHLRPVCGATGTAEAQNFKKMASDDRDEERQNEFSRCLLGIRGEPSTLLIYSDIKVGKLFLVQVQT